MSTIYNNTKQLWYQGDVDLANDVIRVALISDNIAYSPDIDSESFVSDVLDGVSAEEFTGTGYSAQTLTNAQVNQDNANDRAVFDADDTVFTNLDGDTIQAALLYKQVGGDDTTPGDDPLIAHMTSGDFPMPTNGGDITLGWSSAGLCYLA